MVIDTKDNLYFPSAYFTNIKKILNLLSQPETKSLSAKELANKLNFSQNYVFQTTRAMAQFGLLENYGNRYRLTEEGNNLALYVENNEDDKIKDIGERLFLDVNNPNTLVMRKAYSKLISNPNILDYELGNLLAHEFGKEWKTPGTYNKIGGSCKSIINGFNLIKTDKKLNVGYIPKNGDLLGNLNRYCNQFISLVTHDKNAWKNYIDLKQKIEKNYNELMETQNGTLTKLLIQDSKKWLIEGFNTQNIEYIYNSINIIAKLDYEQLIK